MIDANGNGTFNSGTDEYLGPAFSVGGALNFTPTVSGQIYLGFHDDFYPDNQGTLGLQVQFSTGNDDTDGDGIPNTLDTDSDNDGCPDAIEGGGTFTYSNINGLGRLTGGVNADGVPIQAGAGQAIGQSRVATQLIVNTPPSNQTVLPGAAASFTIATTASNNTAWSGPTNARVPVYGTPGNANAQTQYQWHLGNPDAGGTALTNTGVYSGVATATLHISNTTGLYGNVYYVVVAHSNNKCIREVRSATLALSCASLSITPALAQPTCFVSGEISLGVSGGTAPYTYNWADIAGASNPKDRLGLAAGSYSVTVTDAAGCTVATGPLVLNAPGGCAPVTVCRSETNRTFSVAPNAAADAYNWTVPPGAVIVSGQGTPAIAVNFTGVTPGAYSVCCGTQNDCGTSAQTCQNIDVQQAAATATANPVCSGGNLSLFASGGGTYSWSGPDGFTSSSQNPVRYGVTGAQAGNYTVTITTSGGCTATASVAVAVGTDPSLSTAITNTACGTANGSINLTVSGGTAPYTYFWSNSATTEDLGGLVAGNYRVTVTDNNGCTAATNSSVSNTGGGPSLTATPIAVACPGGSNGSINLTVSGGTSPYNYFWSNGASTQNISNVAAGNYGVIVTDATGCQGVTAATVTQANPLQVDATQVNIACNATATGSISLLVSGGITPYSYVWSGPTAIGNTATPTNLLAGTYNVTVTAQGGCTATSSFVLTQPTVLAASATPTAASCFGGADGNVNLTVSGGTAPFTYSWTRSGGGFTASSEDIYSLTAGTYSVTVTDARNCTAIASAVVGQPAAISFASTQVNVLCNGAASGSINLTASGGTPGYTFIWSNGASTEDISSLRAGDYSVTATDTRGCTGTTTVTITQTAALAITPTKTDVLCNGASTGSINLTIAGGTPGYTYAWSDGAATSQNRTNLAAGNYRVTVTDASGCTGTSLISIGENSAIAISGAIADDRCNGGNSGSITLNVNGGAGGYTYAWSGGLPSQKDQASLLAGTYIVTVTDASLCSITASFTVGQPTALTAVGNTVSVGCFEAANGSVDLTVSGGTSPYTFAWSSGAATADVSGLAAGSYAVTVTDFHGCTTTQDFTITEPILLTVAGNAAPNCSSASNGSVSLTVSGGTAPFTYVWSGAGAGSNPRTGLSAGTYQVTITDNRGCTATNDFTLTPLSVGVVGFNRDCAVPNGQVFSSVSGGLEPYTFLWSNGATTENISDLTAGTYTVTVTAGACTATAQYSVTQPASCQPPVAQDDHYTTTVNTPLAGTVMPTDPLNPGYDYDPAYPLDSLIFENLEVLDELYGEIDWNPDGSFTFTPALNFTGTIAIPYEICNPLGLCDQATLYIEVPLTPILAVDDWAGPIDGIPGATAVLNVLDNDLLDGATATTANVAVTETLPDPTGTLTLNPDGTVDVAPNSVSGTYYVSYEICEAVNPTNCSEALVTVTVISQEVCNDGIDNDGDGLVDCADPDCADISLPNLADDHFTTCPGIAVQGVVTMNDGNLQNPIITITSPPTNGSVVINNFGAFAYTPSGNACGYDQFTYQVCNGVGCCATAIATIAIGDNVPPVLVNVPADLTISCDEEVPSPSVVSATDFCPYLTITVEDTNDMTGTGGCGTYTITRTWTATDVCGNSTGKSQLITVTDETVPELFRLYTLPNHKKMVAGNAGRVTHLWKYVKFPVQFDAPPLLFAQVATQHDPTPVVVQTRYITTTGFEMRLREEEAEDQLHGAESVSWMAIEPSSYNGSSFKLAAQMLNHVNHNFQTLSYPFNFLSTPVFIASVNGMAQVDPVTVRIQSHTATELQVRLQEEQSADAETAHANEKLAWLAISNSSNILDSKGRFVAESGTVIADHNWILVNLTRRYTKPVVLVGGLTTNADEAATIRVRNVTPTSFEVRVERWNYLDAVHLNETLGYLVVEGGVPADPAFYCFNGEPLQLGVDLFAIDNCDTQPILTFTETQDMTANGLQIIRTWATMDDCANTDQVTRNDSCRVAAVQLRTLLSGALVNSGTSGLMRDDLRTKGILPVKEPYTGLAGFNTQPMVNVELASPSILMAAGNTAVTDWLFVECRAPGNDKAVLSNRSVMLRRDGSITTATGDSIIYFYDLPEGNYYIAVRHRNHLGLMTDQVHYLSSENPPLIDLSDPATNLRGVSNAFKTVNGKRALWAGDFNGDGKVIYQGPDNDVFRLFSKVLSDPGNTNNLANYIVHGYNKEDFDLDGTSIYQGPGNDRAPLLYQTVLAHGGNQAFLANFIVWHTLP